jgi:hypothetical protein
VLRPFSLGLYLAYPAQRWNRWSVVVNKNATRRTPLWDTICEVNEADLARMKVDLARFRAGVFHAGHMIEQSQALIQESRRLIALASKMQSPKISN